MAQIIDGTATAASIRATVKGDIEAMAAEGLVPGLAIIRVGERPDSVAYVNMKQTAALEVGVNFRLEVLPETVSQEELLSVVTRYNADPAFHGILVQLPLPAHIDERAVLNAIDISKDVDGFHPFNIGAIAMKGIEPFAVPAAPKAVSS